MGSIRSEPLLYSASVSIKTLGCKVNQAESNEIFSKLQAAGIRIVAEEEADVVVLNTCTVTAEADRKARKILRRAKTLARRPIVVVTGCLAAYGGSKLEAVNTRIIVEPDKARVYERVIELLGARVSSGPIARTQPVFSSLARTRAMLKVQDGCDAFCAYCIVPFVRGAPRSIPLDEVVTKAKRLVSSGTPEIVLTGINLGRYSDEGVGLPELIEAVASTGVPRLRLSSIEPSDLTAELLEVLSGCPSMCPHLHVPLQSGSDRVLAAMGRSYTAEEYRYWIEEARKAISGLTVTTDVICGFPTESDADSLETARFCKAVGFSGIHVFRYSAREGTRAALMSGRVDPGVVARRAEALRRVDRELRRRFIGERIGKVLDVLIERVHSDGTCEGTTGDYAHVIVKGATCSQSGGFIRVLAVGSVSDALLGRPYVESL